MSTLSHARQPILQMMYDDLLLQDYFGGAQGGAIFNRGDIVVDGEAEFTGNIGGVRVVHSYVLSTVPLLIAS